MPRTSNVVLLRLGDLLPADLVDRLTDRGFRVTSLEHLSEALPGWVCFLGGWWNPWGAYGLLSRLQEGTVRDLPPVIAAALVHLVAAAVSVVWRCWWCV